MSQHLDSKHKDNLTYKIFYIFFSLICLFWLFIYNFYYYVFSFVYNICYYVFSFVYKIYDYESYKLWQQKIKEKEERKKQESYAAILQNATRRKLSIRSTL